MAFADGVSAVVLEGHEAGGHVGALTSAGLWEEALDGLEDLADQPRLVVFAGGIGDAASAAFAWAMAADADRATGRARRVGACETGRSPAAREGDSALCRAPWPGASHATL